MEKKYYFDVNKEVEGCIKWIREWFQNNALGYDAIIEMDGYRDSTIVASLCVKALGRKKVIGVIMPEKKRNLNGADVICESLGIKSVVCPIKWTKRFLKHSVKKGMGEDLRMLAEINLPQRIKMSMLFAVAESNKSIVVNTINLSRDYVGDMTLFGNDAGFIAPIKNFTITELRLIGRNLGLRHEWIENVKSVNNLGEEDVFCYKYNELDSIIRNLDTTSEIYADRKESILNKHDATEPYRKILNINAYEWNPYKVIEPVKPPVSDNNGYNADDHYGGWKGLNDTY